MRKNVQYSYNINDIQCDEWVRMTRIWCNLMTEKSLWTRLSFTNEYRTMRTSIDPAIERVITSQHEPALMKHTRQHWRPASPDQAFKVNCFDNVSWCTKHRPASDGYSTTPPTTSPLVHLCIRNRLIASKVPQASTAARLLSLFMLLLHSEEEDNSGSVYRARLIHAAFNDLCFIARI